LIRTRLAAAFAAALALAAGCSTSGSSSSTAPPTSAPAPSTTSAPASSTPAPTSALPSSSAPATTSAPPSTSAAPSTSSAPATSSAAPPPPPAAPACALGQLKVSSVRGGATEGQEIAAVVFTNTAAATCTVRGYIFAQLRVNGGPLGDPATHNPARVRTVTLARNGSAQAQLTAVSTCQAPVSDHVRVRLPNSRATASVPIQLRGCALSVDPLRRG
jgi:hypothetical protein